MGKWSIFTREKEHKLSTNNIQPLAPHCVPCTICSMHHNTVFHASQITFTAASVAQKNIVYSNVVFTSTSLVLILYACVYIHVCVRVCLSHTCAYICTYTHVHVCSPLTTFDLMHAQYVCVYICTCIFVGSCLATKILKAHISKLKW